ncbi:MAG: NUDIX domain-containing protein [Candidatus Lokiarchaeota archaeon]|nr:NUDIX domain-containing protein [Candidatus Lokiarchaeota archaeon]
MINRRRYPIRPILGVGSVILRNNSQVLIIERASEPDKDMWSIPGGVVEYNERPEFTAKREVYEETTLNVKIGPLIDVVNKIIPNDNGDRIKYHFVILDYLVESFTGQARASDDAKQLIWCDYEDLPSYSYPDTIVELFKKVNIWPE